MRSIFGIGILPDRFAEADAVASAAQEGKREGRWPWQIRWQGIMAARVSPSGSSTSLRAAEGADAPLTPENLAPFDHFHGRGVVATEELAAQLAPKPGERLLDIGSGIGGPARW